MLTKVKSILFVGALSIALSVHLSAAQDNFKWMRTVQQQTVRDYSHGLSAFYENGLWGFVSTAGVVVIEPVYDEVSDFDGAYIRVCKEGKWGVITNANRVIFPCRYDSITTFTDGVALAVSNGTKFYLYTTGDVKKLPSTYDFYEYSEGFAKIRDNRNGKWGYIDNKGVIRINPRFDTASDFKAGHAVVTMKGKTYSINKSGDRHFLPFKVNQKVVVFSNGAGYVQRLNGNLSFFTKGFRMTPGEYKEIHDFSEGVACVKSLNGNIAYIDELGQLAVRVKGYSDAGDFKEGKAWVKGNSSYGYIDKKGNLVIDTLFSYVSDFNSHLAYVAMGQRHGVIKHRSPSDKFPMLDISDIRLVDSNGNNAVEAEENFDISMVVKNVGDAPLDDPMVVLGLSADQMEWFSYDSTKYTLETLEPGEEQIVTFKGYANTNVVSEDINLTFRGEADNLFRFQSYPYSFKASGLLACKPVLETFWVYTENHAPLQPGCDAFLKLTVKNTGSDMAKDVMVNLDWPDGVDYTERKLVIPFLAPNETKEIITMFSIPEESYNYHREFSMVAMVDEFTHNREDVKYLSFATGRHNALTNVLSGVSVMPGTYSAASQPVKNMAPSELLVDLAPNVKAAKNRYALVFGNEDYNSMKQSAMYQPDVEFAVRDAETFAKFATNMMGVSKDNIILIKNATYAQMKVGMEKLSKLAKANPDSLELIVYYAGHGQVDGDTKDSYLIPVDVSLTSPTAGMKLEDFYASLSACNAQKTFVFLDACYSGVGRGIIIRPKQTLVKGNLVVMTATSSTQKSMPYQEKNHGLFTYYLLKTLKEGGSGMTVGELFDQVSETVKTKSILINNSEQTPELLGGSGISQDWRNWVF